MTKNVRSSGASAVGQKKITAVATREQGTENFAKGLAFVYTVPTSLRELLNTWIAVSKPNYSLNNALYTQRSIEEDQVSDLKKNVEQVMGRTCVPLTV